MGGDATVCHQYIENDGGLEKKAESSRLKAQGSKLNELLFIKEMTWISHIPQPNLKG